MTVPEPLLRYSRECVESQREHWRRDKWLPVFRDHDHLDLYDELVAHDEQANGIARSFIHDRAGRKPIELFLLTMVWGFGDIVKTCGWGCFRRPPFHVIRRVLLV